MPRANTLNERLKRQALRVSRDVDMWKCPRCGYHITDVARNQHPKKSCPRKGCGAFTFDEFNRVPKG